MKVSGGIARTARIDARGRTTVTISNFKDASGNSVPDGTVVAATAQSCETLTLAQTCIFSAGGNILGGNPATFNSTFQLFTITNGQVSFQYSDQNVSVASGQQTATVALETVTPQGGSISNTAIATVNVQLLSIGSGSVAATPSSLLADAGMNGRFRIAICLV